MPPSGHVAGLYAASDLKSGVGAAPANVEPAGVVDGTSFCVTVGMTSLTGTSAEDFASILRSLGYRMERRPKPQTPAPPAPEGHHDQTATPPAAEGHHDETAAPPAPEGHDEGTVPKSEAAEPVVAAQASPSELTLVPTGAAVLPEASGPASAVCW